MAETEQTQALKIDPVSASAVAALQDDPFYRSICGVYALDPSRRRAILSPYFDFSIQEGRELGRCVHLPNPALGVAVWLLPQSREVQSRAAHKKHSFLQATLDTQGWANYYRIVDFMHAQSATLVDSGAWYLSIVAVAPSSQGQGLGRKLLEPTLSEADSVSATCYLETFGPRNLAFYQRLGFAAKARFAEPTTGAEYALMVRPPLAPAQNLAF